MPMTTDELRGRIDLDELDYPAIALTIGPDALPALRELVATGDPGLAAKATHLASLIEGGDAVVEAAAVHRDPVVRVAAANAVANLTTTPAGLLASLLGDQDLGVRKLALRAAAKVPDATLRDRLATIAEHDASPALRELAKEAGDKIPA